jgi:hypothetical protein
MAPIPRAAAQKAAPAILCGRSDSHWQTQLKGFRGCGQGPRPVRGLRAAACARAGRFSARQLVEGRVSGYSEPLVEKIEDAPGDCTMRVDPVKLRQNDRRDDQEDNPETHLRSSSLGRGMN